ncbi:MAG: hypothetical protein GX987_02160 [Tissierellia bacterium]|nr:hypothetical protein [Tissierellia bacterium]
MPKHPIEQNMLYFITSVTENRKQIFSNNLACELFLNILTYNKFYCDYNIYAFIIMPDHFHIIIQPTGEMNISEIMKKIKGNFSRFYNKIFNNQGKVLQKGYYDKIIRDEKHLIEIIEYIHNNPINKGIVENVDDYIYSSYHYYNNKNRHYELLMRR